jgi:hypothetical protein
MAARLPSRSLLTRAPQDDIKQRDVLRTQYDHYSAKIDQLRAKRDEQLRRVPAAAIARPVGVSTAPARTGKPNWTSRTQRSTSG